MVVKLNIGGTQRDFEVAASNIISAEIMCLVQSQRCSIAAHYSQPDAFGAGRTIQCDEASFPVDNRRVGLQRVSHFVDTVGAFIERTSKLTAGLASAARHFTGHVITHKFTETSGLLQDDAEIIRLPVMVTL